MNREFKFRVWDIVNKRMLSYGDMMTLPMWEVFPGTPEQIPFKVMQYTGLKDKNGKEIYEGDIVKCDDEDLAVITWGQEGNYILQSINLVETCDINEFVTTIDLEIVGNIYDNRDFLEGDE